MADQVGHSVAAQPEESLGPRKLTTIHAVGQALGVGPIFSGEAYLWGR